MTNAIDTNELNSISANIREYSEKIAKEKGWILNPDKRITDAIFHGLARNMILSKKPYCPCRKVSGIVEKDIKYICPCENAEYEIITFGHCHCYLYLKSN